MENDIAGIIDHTFLRPAGDRGAVRALCREAGCRHCVGKGCSRGVALPPDHRLNARPCRPEECPDFSAKEGGRA